MRLTSIALALALLATAAHAETTKPWTAAWATSQMIPTDNNILPQEDFTDATLRQVIRVNRDGDTYRLRLSNQFGTAPLTIETVRLARALSPATSGIDTATTVKILFNGRDTVTVPAGAELLSDPIAFTADDQTDLTITFYIPKPPIVETSHPGSRATSYLVHGRYPEKADLPTAKTFPHWFFITSLEVQAAPTTKAIVTFGDSITDGYGVKPDTNTRWPDNLARRLTEAGLDRPVLNSGIGGNRLLLDGLGPNALARFDREVLNQPGVGYVILLEGVNDLGVLTRDAPATPEAHAELVSNMIMAYQQLIERAHAHGIRIYGATIMPFHNDYYHPPAETEADRLAVNAWIRDHSGFDAIIDFDAILRDPADPGRLNPAYDSGDHLHPSIDGYKAMGEAVPLSLFK